MTRFTTFAAALSMLVLPATAAFAQDGNHDAEGTFQPSVTAFGFSGPRVAGPLVAAQFNEGQGGDTRLGRPAASLSGSESQPIQGYAFNPGANGNG